MPLCFWNLQRRRVRLSARTIPRLSSKMRFRGTEAVPGNKEDTGQGQEKGLLYLSGSQQLKFMEGVSESRIGIVSLLGVSQRDKSLVSFDRTFLPTDDYFAERNKELAPLDYDGTWRSIQRGCLPEMVLEEQNYWQLFYGSYVSTCIDRGVRDLAKVGNGVSFTRFMSAALAALVRFLTLTRWLVMSG
jgi:hypothetical protein